MEHAARHEIHLKLEEDPAFYSSLKDRLEQIIELRKNKRIDDAEQLQLFADEILAPMRERGQLATDLGLSERAFAIMGVLDGARPHSSAAEDGGGQGYSANTDLAALIEEAIEPLLAVKGWGEKDDLKRQVRRKIKQHLRASGLSNDAAGDIATRIVRLAGARL